MTKKIELSFDSGKNISRLASLCLQCTDPDEGRFELDFSKVDFVHPVGITGIACLVKKLKGKGNEVPLLGIESNRSVVSYLERMHFFDVVDEDSPVRQNHYDQTRNLVELHEITSEVEVDDCAPRLAAALLGLSIEQVAEDEAGKKIAYILAELLNNSLQHGRRANRTDANVFVCCQHYSNGEIRLAVADGGCGIRESFNFMGAGADVGSHLASIDRALQHRESCNRAVAVNPNEATNAGVGLTITGRVISDAGGAMRILSGDAVMTIGSGVQRGVELDQGTWFGTVVEIKVDRSKLNKEALSSYLSELAGEIDGQEPDISFSD